MVLPSNSKLIILEYITDLTLRTLSKLFSNFFKQNSMKMFSFQRKTEHFGRKTHTNQTTLWNVSVRFAIEGDGGKVGSLQLFLSVIKLFHSKLQNDYDDELSEVGDN